MTVEMKQTGSRLEVKIRGRIDALTSPDLEAELTPELPGLQVLVLDFERVAYISSAGLRLLLTLQKTMAGQGRMVIRHVNETVGDVFEITGFADILNIE